MSENEFSVIHSDLLIFSGRNPRQEMKGIEEFAENIKEYGVLQPIIVRPKEDKFEIVVGERRVRAATMAGLKEIPAIIRSLTDVQTDELRLIENIQREDLTSPEKGDAVLALIDNFPEKYPTIKSVAEMLRTSDLNVREWIYKSRKLSDFVKASLLRKTLHEYPAFVLTKYDTSTQDILAKKIIDTTLTSRQSVEFLKLYDKNPNSDLDDIAQEAKGLKKVEVPLKALSEESRKEIEQIFEKNRKPLSEEVKAKISKTNKEMAGRKREARKRLKEKMEITKLEDIPAKAIELTEKLANIDKPELQERMTKEVTKGIEAITKRIEGAPEKSIKMEKKFARLKELEEKGLILYTIWDFEDRGDYAGHKDFVSNCSPQVVEQCVLRLTEKDDLILDPMAGSGTALDVFHILGRRCIGFDIKPTRPDIRLNDSQTLPLESESIDMVFIHPPYWNLITYTNAEENLPDLSRASTFEEYLNMLKQVFQECFRVLKPEKYMCVLLGDMIREGRFIPICRKATNLAEEIGFTDCGFAVKIAHGEVSRKKSGVIFAELAYTENLKISHDFVMFFRKS